MANSGDLFQFQDKKDASSGLIQLSGLDDGLLNLVSDILGHDGQNDLLFWFDGDAEQGLCLPDAGSPAVDNGPAFGSSLFGGLENAFRGVLVDDSNDEVELIPVLCGFLFFWTWCSKSVPHS